MLLRQGTLPLFLLLWLASAQSATLATLSQSTEEADTGEDTLTGRPGTEGQLARSEGTPGSSETLEPPPETGEPQEPQAETREAQEPQPDTGEPQEPQAETREAQEPQPDTGEPQEPQAEAREAQEPQPDTKEPQEPKPDITVSEDVIATHKIESETPQAQDPSASALPDHPDTLDGGASLEEALFEQDWYQGPVKKAEESGWGLGALRSSFQTFNGYFDSMVELVGGRNGVCQYRCRHGLVPQPRPGYLQPEPDGCASSLVGMQFDLGIPAMTQCCDQLDSCYDICGSSKYRCDSKFRWCLHSICTDLKKSLGFVSKVQACESGADALYNTVWSLGCRPYMNSQRAACVCAEEEREEL